MEDISLHILDIVENSIAVSASRVEITVVEDMEKDLLLVEIKDNGQGMSEERLEKVLDPFFTTKSVRKVGLGLPLLAQAARQSGGDIEIESKVGIGTRVKATFQHSHPDRKPLGDIPETMRILRAGNPDIEFVYKYEKIEDSKNE
ncbi:ATP-binding protein [candidate division TA06 bacterium]|uniref:histidine kinase n=1 Tax=candidate division TA06 bacterium TaxID=2250710 RepID=A0A523UXS6_UNCT6|nr:MAG: ATP-binding protein [candidate division TA06 bacterium]